MDKGAGVGASATMVTTLHRSEPVFRQMPQPGLQAPVLQPRCGWGLSDGYFRSIRADRETRAPVAEMSATEQPIASCPNTTICARERIRYRLACAAQPG